MCIRYVGIVREHVIYRVMVERVGAQYGTTCCCCCLCCWSALHRSISLRVRPASTIDRRAQAVESTASVLTWPQWPGPARTSRQVIYRDRWGDPVCHRSTPPPSSPTKKYSIKIGAHLSQSQRPRARVNRPHLVSLQAKSKAQHGAALSPAPVRYGTGYSTVTKLCHALTKVRDAVWPNESEWCARALAYIYIHMKLIHHGYLWTADGRATQQRPAAWWVRRAIATRIQNNYLCILSDFLPIDLWLTTHFLSMWMNFMSMEWMEVNTFVAPCTTHSRVSGIAMGVHVARNTGSLRLHNGRNDK